MPPSLEVKWFCASSKFILNTTTMRFFYGLIPEIYRLTKQSSLRKTYVVKFIVLFRKQLNDMLAVLSPRNFLKYIPLIALPEEYFRDMTLMG